MVIGARQKKKHEIQPQDVTQNGLVVPYKKLCRSFIPLGLSKLRIGDRRRETRIRKKSTWTTRTNGGIRLDSRRLNEDRRRLGTGTRVEAGPQSETNRREEGRAC